MNNHHIPVLLDPVLGLVSEKDVIFDGTFGGGGYVEAFLQKKCVVFTSDLDNTVKTRRADLFTNLDLHFSHNNFADYITSFDDKFFDLITVDLGFSSNQLEESERGFSYLKPDEVFDFRYDVTSGKPCWQRVEELKSANELSRILFTYSGESLSRRIADRLFETFHKSTDPLTVGEFSEVVIAAIPQKFMRSKNAILSRIWQALRIWINNEFESIERFMPVAINKLKPNGMLAVVCFHSLEDKLVTKFMRTVSMPEIVDDFGNKKQDYKMLSSKGIVPTENEILDNPRSRSAILRILTRLSD